MNNVEQTLSIIKPDAVERNLAEEIKEIFKANNLKIYDVKIHITKDEAAEFYKKCINQNLFIMIYVLIYLPGPL